MATIFTITYASVLTGFLFFLLLGLFVANTNVKRRVSHGEKSVTMIIDTSVNSFSEDTSNSGVLRIITAVPLIALAAVGAFYVYKMYPGEYFMRKAALAAMANSGNDTYQYQGKAINASPRKDVYHNAYAQTNLTLALNLASKGELTDPEKQTVQTLLAQAIRSARATTEVLNPANVAGWEVRASIYRALINTAQDADRWTIEALNRAIQLDPTNPRLRVDLGGIYYARQDYLSAANMFRQATNLKADYANAYYNFGQSLLQLQDYANARRAFEITQSLVPEGSTDYEMVATSIASIDAMPQVAGTQSDRPTVEEIEMQIAEEEEVTEQEPLINEGEETIKESTQSEAIVE